ncbi:MAG TPA: FxsA family protein [Nitrospirae bacterium]|nr:phage T7 F exclusion suppressor FxsA [bacterium BMS3Abin06]HDH12510.1 FxsA family protein [Nitrospirota bacterium]HDZ00669.1 FxsA family protein [Nitrospirota bacterium]
MFFKLFLIFSLIPVIELALLIKVGSLIGALNTIIIVILTAIIGAYLVRLEGLGVMYRIQKNMQEGIFPAEELINGAMILVAGAMLLTPGFFTDIIGFLMVFPVSREYIKKIASRYIRKKTNSDEIEIDIS